MSHQIYYGKQFVKLNNNKLLPFMWEGSNNCTEFSWNGRERRERNWSRQGYFSNGKMFPTAEDILKSIDDFRQGYIERYKDDVEDKYDDKRFGWFAGCRLTGKHGMTFGEFKGMFTTGIKQAMTVEELKTFGIDLVMWVYHYKPEDITDKGFEIKERLHFNTTDEVEQKYNEWKEYYGELADRITFYLDCEDYQYDRLKKSRTKAKVKREKVRKEFDSYWVLSVKGGGYYVKSTRRYIRHTPHSDYAKQFVDEASVNKFHAKMKNKGHVEPVKINEKTTMYV